MKSSPFHVKLIFGLIFALFKTDSSSLKIDVELCSKGCKVNNSVCDNTGQCISNDCKLYQNDLNYNGNISVVKHGFQCLFWNNGTHKQFPMMQHNFCRTPSEDPEEIPWCYTQHIKTIDIDRYWDHCDIPVCGFKKLLSQGVELGTRLSTPRKCSFRHASHTASDNQSRAPTFTSLLSVNLVKLFQLTGKGSKASHWRLNTRWGSSTLENSPSRRTQTSAALRPLPLCQGNASGNNLEENLD
ncbi:Hypothetical predicted protein [Mytilus galloprovincialis]|uniref:Kringle domain-containing protein n=1 Tax=Mytilus galloprovincialis TaxID=29158 RepID=A0A8B6G712_MYTGA|nr:Hypothetical predicted protein [Mytilus galloprovincialis]